ncbi:DUF3604 domain-containing protein [candidate division KSB1 bacterium]|nr:DUF3604 domain-containing protein [candidate division KSB1 bacterium]
MPPNITPAHTAEKIPTSTWYEHVRTWQGAEPVDITAAIEPGTAKANQAESWKIKVKLGDFQLLPGDHVAVELHVGWRMDRGRPYVSGRLPIEERPRYGYSTSPKVVLPPGAAYEIAVDQSDRMRRYFIIDICIQSGKLPEGSEFEIFPADADASLLRCPWFAQDVPIPIAVRPSGERYYRRIKQFPVLHVIGGEPRLWRIAATLQPSHERARISVIAADIENLNPTEVALQPNILPCDGWQIEGLERTNGYHGAPVWRGIARLSKKHAPRIECLNRERGLYGRSNPVEPELFENYQVYFGDIHGQSDRSIGFGTEEEYFSWARDAELLDFTAPANHYGGRERFSQALWRDTVALCDEFNEEGRFVTFYSYEWGSAVNQHRNIYYRDTPGMAFCRHGGYTDDIHDLWRLLDEQKLPALTIPHHLKFIGGRMKWLEYNATYQRLAEVCSIWGNSEKDSAHSLQAGLAMGHRLGVVGGTDTHFSQPGRPVDGPFDLGGITAIIAPKLERCTLWDALHARRCYATTGERILLDFRMNGQLMGSQLAATGQRKLIGMVIGTTELEQVEIIRNNRLWQSIPVAGDESVAFEFDDPEPFGEIALNPQVPEPGRFAFYYLRVTQRDRHWAMSSPIWVVG